MTRADRAGAQVVFHYSIGSRYSYLASTRLAALSQETGCRIDWRPVHSLRLIGRRPDDPFAVPDPTGIYAPAYRAEDLARWAAHYDVPYVEPTGRVRFEPEVLALACTAARRLGVVEPVSRGLFAAMYEGGLDAIDRSACADVAASCGIDADRFAVELAAPATAAELEATTLEAASRGVFGVPTFLVGGQLFFGNDRIVLLRDFLLRTRGSG